MTKIDKPANDQFIEAKPDSNTLVAHIIEGMESKKAKDIAVLDISAQTTLADFFVICTGNSDTQIKAIADAVEQEVQEKTGDKAWKKEGLQARSWIILDFIHTVVHIMTEGKRHFYNLELMWNDAKATYIESKESSDGV
jgi:ribosome-associated protein